MIIKQNNATPNRPEGERIIEAASLAIDLHTLIIQIKSEDAWLKSDRNSITVFKTAQMTIVLGALHQGAEMLHKSEGVMSVQVLEGTIDADTDELSALLYPGHMVAVNKGYNFRLLAAEEAVYLLTITDVS